MAKGPTRAGEVVQHRWMGPTPAGEVVVGATVGARGRGLARERRRADGDRGRRRQTRRVGRGDGDGAGLLVVAGLGPVGEVVAGATTGGRGRGLARECGGGRWRQGLVAILGMGWRQAREQWHGAGRGFGRDRGWWGRVEVGGGGSSGHEWMDKTWGRGAVLG